MKKTFLMTRHIVVMACALLLFSSCHQFWGERIHGNGSIRKETRSAGSFSSVDVSGAIHVYVKQGSANAVEIETDENLLGYIVTRTEGDRLVIEPRDRVNLDATGAVKVYVTAQVFRVLHASGACKIFGDGRLTSNDPVELRLSGASELKIDVKAPKVTADISGASKVMVSGETKDLAIECDGASHARCFDLMAENADVDASGASSAEVYASVSLKGDASGASHIRYKGNASVNSNTSGASSLDKAD